MPFPSPGDLPNPGTEPGPPTLQAHALPSKPPGKPKTITPTTETVCVPAQLGPPGSPQAKQLHHLHAQLSLGQSCDRKKKKNSCVHAHRVVSVLSNSLQSCRLWPARLLCQRDCSPGRNTGVYWTSPSRALYFLLP